MTTFADNAAMNIKTMTTTKNKQKPRIVEKWILEGTSEQALGPPLVKDRGALHSKGI